MPICDRIFESGDDRGLASKFSTGRLRAARTPGDRRLDGETRRFLLLSQGRAARETPPCGRQDNEHR